MAFIASNYISLQNNFYLTSQDQEFQASVVAHILITQPRLVTGRVKGRKGKQRVRVTKKTEEKSVNS